MKMHEEKRKPILTFEHTVKIHVYKPDFIPLSTIEFLDAKKLAETDQKFEIGRMEGGCCDQLVYAEIKEGMVVGVEVAPCEDNEFAIESPVSNDIKAILSEVSKKLEHPEKWEPIPVTTFIAMAKRDPIKIGGGTNCVWICVGSWGCLICCNNPPRCWTTPRGGNVLASP